MTPLEKLELAMADMKFWHKQSVEDFESAYEAQRIGAVEAYEMYGEAYRVSMLRYKRAYAFYNDLRRIHP